MIYRTRQKELKKRLGAYTTDYIDTEQFAYTFGISEVAARARCASGTIPAAKLGKKWYIDRLELIRRLSGGYTM